MTRPSANAVTTARKAERREDSAFGKIALELELLTRAQLDRCLAEQKKLAEKGKHIRLGKLLVARSHLTTRQFLEILDRQNKTILTCPSCAAQYNVKHQPAGKRMRCKHCKEVLTVPTEIETLTVQDTLEEAGQSDTRLQANSRTFGNYVVLEEIARGGMGIVFRARQQGSFDREVALKVLKRDRLGSDEHLQRFFREARLAGRLTHPNIVPVYEVGECEGEPYFSMAYVRGQSLEEALRTGALAKSRALELIETIAAGVQYAHEQGIVHRDLKPGNILIDEDGRPQLSDFGLAKHLEGQSLTQSGIDIGTPHYMSPEQVLGQVERIDERSDVYALGVMLYQMMTRRLPFGGKSAIEIYHKILNHTPARPSSLKRGLPRELDVICAKAMARQPEQRYPSAAEFAADVRRLRLGQPIEARPPVLLVRLFWTARRHQWACAATLFVALLGLLGLGLALNKNRRPENPAPDRSRGETPPAQQPAPQIGPSPAERDARQARLLLLKADTAFQRSRFDEAQGHLKQALQLAPRDFKLHYLMGQVHQRSGRPEQAIAAYRRCLAFNPAHWEAVQQLGYALFDLKQTAEAHTTFSRLIALNKRLPQEVLAEAYRMRGRCHYLTREDELALSDLEQALELDAKNYLAHHWLGILYFAHKKLYPPAKMEFTRALAIRANYVPALLFRGACSAYLLEYDAAFDDFSRAYDIDPQWVHQFIEMGLESDYDAKRYEVDVAETRRFLTELKSAVTALALSGKVSEYKTGLYLGLYHHYIRKYEQAVDFLTRAIAKAPFEHKRRLYIFRGLSLDMLGRHQQAIEDFSSALATQPNDVFGRLHRATSYLRLGQWDKAQADLERVVRHDADEVRAPLHLALLALQRKDWSAARSWLDRARRIAPSDSRCHSLAAWFACTAPPPHRDLAAAQRLAEQGLRHNRSVALSWGVAGLVLEAAGDGPRAVEHFKKALERKPTHWFFTAEFYRKRLQR